MAKSRMVKTSFRTDSYIEEIDPLDKVLFLYLLTNEYVDLCGIYELSIKRMGFETGLDVGDITEMLERLRKDIKVYHLEGYIIIVNFIKNQKTNPNIKKGIERSLQELPEKVWKAIRENEELIEAFESLSKATPLYLTLLNLTLPNLTPPHLTQSCETGVDEKIIFLDFIKMSKEEHTTLLYEYGASNVNKFMRKLNIHLGSKGDHYDSHFYTLLNWFDKYDIKPEVNKKIDGKQEKEHVPMTKEQIARSKSLLAKARQMTAKKIPEGKKVT